MRVLAALSLGFVMAMTIGAEARTRHQQSDLPVFDRAGRSSDIGARMFIREVKPQRVRTAGFKQIRKRWKRGKVESRQTSTVIRTERAREQSSSTSPQIVEHPQGCPSRAFCGCGAALEVFGRHVRDLWLASNWLRFPRTEPAPGMVAVRRHHVFVIREVRGPGLVLAYDANSGGRKTRVHLRSLSGFTVVNPRGGSRYATAG